MIRRVVFVLFLMLLAITPSAVGQSPGVPDAPFFTRTINLAPGEQQTIEEAFSANSSCDAIGTRYVLVVKNGNPDGSGMVQSGAAAINLLDYVGDWLADGADVITMDVPLLSSNVALLQGQAPPDSAAVLTMELWRKPVTATPFHQAYSFPQSTVNKKYTASFPIADPSIPAMLVVTRIGGMQTADQFFIKLNGTNFFSRTNFQYPVETLVAFVNLLPTNSVVIDAVAASQSSEVTVRVVQHGADTTPPAINLTGTIPAKVGTDSFTFSGNVTDANRIGSLKLNGTKVNFTSSSGAFTTTVPLTHGIPNEFTFLAYDCAGHGTQVVKVIEWDRDPPVVTVTSPATNAFVKGPITVTGTVTDDTLGSPTVKVNGITATVTGNTWSANITLPGPDGAKTINAVATDLFQRSSSATVPVTLDATAPTITGSVWPAPLSSGWTIGEATVSFECADAVSGIASCTEPVMLTEDGIHTLAGTATDLAGNQATTSFTAKIDGATPQISISTMAAFAKESPFTITGTVGDAHSGILSVRCGDVDATLAGSTFTCAVPLVRGANMITLSTVDRVGNETITYKDVQLDERVPLLTITTPQQGEVVNNSQLTVTGTVADDDQVATVRVDGAAVAVAGGTFSKLIALAPGDNTIVVDVSDRAGNLTSQSVGVNRFIVPVVTITSPADLAVLNTTTATITGTISDPSSTVTVNDIAASVSGGNFTATSIPLQQGRTVITANAISSTGGAATTSINVYRDSIPPRLEVYSPQEGSTVYASPISISGMVDDIVVGTINARQMRVKVNGADAEVSNRAFLMRNVALSPGLNNITITATDEGGNVTVVAYRVTLVPAPPQPHLEIVSGNGQSGTIGTTLAAPLVVRAVAPDGAAVAASPLTFEIADNDGTLSDGTNSGRSITVVTDVQGRAQVTWTLGNRAGAGNHRVSVRGLGFAAPIEATAAAQTGTPHLIVIDSGNNQFGVAGDALPRPLIAIAVDTGNNRLANVQVTFTAVEGGGSFDGQQSIVVMTDSDGRAVARPTLGPDPGEDNNIFGAAITGVTNSAVFVASGRAAGPQEATRITGVILDNTSIPIAGVTVRIEGTQNTAQTDAQGQFTITNAPVGYVKLFVDGSTAQRPGTWPTLEYALYTLPGTENSVGMPIYLVQLDTARGLFVDDTTGGTLTLPELPGFALEVKAGSATFPGGGRTGTVSATLVHADRIPMVPGFGQQPKFIITIQPPGTHFDPPARLTLPNTDGLAPGASTEMYSFDHDLGQFVTIGSATVSADGATMKSDPGVGIIKGGWHAGGDPAPDGGGSDCTECAMFVEATSSCATDPAKDGQECKADDLPCTHDMCVNGREVHREGTIIVTLESPDDFNIQTDPRMPTIIARGRVEGITPDPTPAAIFRWKAKIEYTAPNGREINVELPEVQGNNTWRPVFPNIRGGRLTVRGTLVRYGRTCRYDEDTKVINGLNPPFTAVRTLLGDATLAKMVCHESENGRHFDPSPGPPNTHVEPDGRIGVGFMQVTTPRPSDDAFWNWRTNINEGLAIWRTAQDEADDYYDRMLARGATELTEEQQMQNRVTRYNGGYYWYWREVSEDVFEWVDDPRLQPWPACRGQARSTRCRPYWDLVQAENSCQ